MTYKLEPGMSRITSPVRLVMDGKIREFENGMAATEAVFDKKYGIAEITAVDNVVEIKLKEMDVLAANWDKESFF